MYIEEAIGVLRKRPGMVVSKNTIEYIYYFIAGNCVAGQFLECDEMDKMFSSWFGKWLLQWIEENINPMYTPMTSFWYLDIKAIAGGEEKEVPLFYELCEKFFDDYRNRRGYFSDLPVEDE